MAFAGFDALFTKGISMKIVDALERAGKATKRFHMKLKALEPVFKKLKKAHDVFFKPLFQTVGNFATVGLDMLGVMLQLAQSMGVLQPLMDMFAGVLQIMGGAALEEMIPALESLAEFLFSDEMILFWEELGTAMGEFLSWMITTIIDLLKDPAIRKLILNAMDAISKILVHIGKLLITFVELLSKIDIKTLGAIIYGLAMVFAFFQGLSSAPGIAGLILGAAYMTLAGVLLAPLLALQTGGIVTKPSLALIAESGPEAVIPLGEGGAAASGFGGQELVWEMEDMNTKLDTLIKITGKTRLRAIR